MGVSNREYDRTYPKITIKHKEPYEFDLLYKKMYYWCQNYGYKPQDGSAEGYETIYHERHYPGFSELWLTWKFRKKLNEYIMHDMKVQIQILGKDHIEVPVEGGKKKKMDTGELVIDISGEIAFNKKMEEEWKKRHIFGRPMELVFPFSLIKQLFKIRTIKDTLDYWEEKSFSKHHSFAEMCKDVLGIKI